MQRHVYDADHEIGTKMVTVRVGPDKQTQDFAIYEKLIRQSSAFMDTTLKEPWKESTDRVVCLPDFDKDTFDIYHLWLLSGKLHSKKKPQKDHSVTMDCRALQDELEILRQLSRLGHYILDTAFTDTVCDAILQCYQEIFPTRGIVYLRSASHFYKVIPEGSPVRSLIADVIAWTTNRSQLYALKRGYPKYVSPDFLVDVLYAVSERFMRPATSTSPLRQPDVGCKYHSHGEKEVCYKTQGTGLLSPDRKRAAPADNESPTAKRQR